MKMHFIHRYAGDGYDLHGLPPEGKRSMWQFIADPVHPVEWWDSDDNRWRTDRSFKTDGRSGFLGLDIILGDPLRYAGCLFHDSGYRHGGLWREEVQARVTGKWVFVPLSKSALDRMLCAMIIADGPQDSVAVARRTAQAVAVWAGLTLGGLPAWWLHRHSRRSETARAMSR